MNRTITHPSELPGLGRGDDHSGTAWVGIEPGHPAGIGLCQGEGHPGRIAGLGRNPAAPGGGDHPGLGAGPGRPLTGWPTGTRRATCPAWKDPVAAWTAGQSRTFAGTVKRCNRRIDKIRRLCYVNREGFTTQLKNRKPDITSGHCPQRLFSAIRRSCRQSCTDNYAYVQHTYYNPSPRTATPICQFYRCFSAASRSFPA